MEINELLNANIFLVKDCEIKLAFGERGFVFNVCISEEELMHKITWSKRSNS